MVQLLSPTDVRLLADDLGVRPTKKWGQNFVVDPGTVRRIARIAQVGAHDHVLEVGPGLGSLTLALMETGARVTAVDIDERLVQELPAVVSTRAPEHAHRFSVLHHDALQLTPDDLRQAYHEGTEEGESLSEPTALVANLPYNVSVPVILHVLETFPSIRKVLVMVQSEVAARLTSSPGSRIYGIPSVKVAWYAQARAAGEVKRNVFYPVPRVDSSLVWMERRDQPMSAVPRTKVFALVDAAFAHRRKALRGALATYVGGAEQAEHALRLSGIDPWARGETLAVEDFVRLAETIAHG